MRQKNKKQCKNSGRIEATNSNLTKRSTHERQRGKQKKQKIGGNIIL